MHRRRDAELDASPHHGPAERVHLETAPVVEVSGHRRAPVWGQRRGLREGAIHGVRGERSPFRPRDGRDLLARGRQERAALGAGDERTDGRARERRDATDAGDEEEFRPQHALDARRDLVRDAACFECAGDPLHPIGQGPGGFAEDDLAFAAGANDDARTGELERDVDRAGEHRPGAGDTGDRCDVVDTVLQGHHRRVSGHQWLQRLGRRLRVVRLHAEEDEIDGPDARGVSGRCDADCGLPVRGSHGEATSLHRLEVRATRDERDVVPGFREKRPVVPADPAGSEHGDPHLKILLRVGMVGEARPIRRSNAEQW